MAAVLSAFENHVNAQAGKQLISDQAQTILTQAAAIATAIGC